MKPLTKILLLVALAALPLLGMTGPAQGAKKMEVAIQNEGVFLYNNYYDQDTAYRQLRELGATHLRMNLFWFQAVTRSQQELTTKPRTSNTTSASGIQRSPRRTPTASRSSSR